MEKIIGVYNANGGLLGEIEYLTGKLLHIKHCSLCDITHGLSMRAKDEWVSQVNSFSIPIETKHLNEIDSNIFSLVKNNTPCVVYIKGETIKIIMYEKDLVSCDKDPYKFFELLRKKVQHLTEC